MVGPDIPEIQKGQRITASWLNKLRKWVIRVSKIYADPPLEIVDGPAGVVIRYSQPDEFWVKITSGSNPYAWTKVLPATGGTFVTDGSGLTGTTSVDPAREVNGITTIAANTIVKVRRAYSTNELLFSYDHC